MYKLIISKQAEKEIDALPTYMKENVDAHILALSENPRPHECKKLEGFANAYRLRVGKYRIVYTIENNILTINIIGVKHRKEAYDDL